jgi:hypothetical protein
MNNGFDPDRQIVAFLFRELFIKPPFRLFIALLLDMLWIQFIPL